ncbi:MAG: STAS-like domain-containing protein [Flavobacteriales bacterium]|jgi:hypothetical protein
MDSITLNIFNIVGSPFCVEADDGDRVYHLVIKALEAKRKVVLSFYNVEMLTTAFLNTAVGQLYRDYSEDFIKENLSVDGMSKSGLVSLKRVVDTAKLFYKDPDAMRRSIDDILDE